MKGVMKATELRIGNFIVGYVDNTSEIEDEEIECIVKVVALDNADVTEHRIWVIGEHDFERYDDFYGIPLTEEWLLKFGFEEIPHFTVANNLIKDLGNRERHLSFGDLGTPNEMLWLHEGEDIVCLHNYDYNGKMHVHQLQNLYFALTGEELTIKEPI